MCPGNVSEDELKYKLTDTKQFYVGIGRLVNILEFGTVFDREVGR